MWLMVTRSRVVILVVIVAAMLARYAQSQKPPAAPGMKVFTAADGTFQFSYPGQFRICDHRKIAPCVLSYIPACETDALVCAVYPEEKFEGTNFGAAAFEVRKISSTEETMTPDICATPYPPKYSGGVSEYPEFLISAQHPTERIGGVLFVHGSRVDAAMGTAISVDIYRAFHNQTCFELSLSQSEANPALFDPPKKTLTQAQMKEMSESFSAVLHSFRFLKQGGLGMVGDTKLFGVGE